METKLIGLYQNRFNRRVLYCSRARQSLAMTMVGMEVSSLVASVTVISLVLDACYRKHHTKCVCRIDHYTAMDQIDSCTPSLPFTLPPVQTGILPVHATEPGPSCLPELQGHMVSQESYPLHGTMHNSELVHSTMNHIRERLWLCCRCIIQTVVTGHSS